jgi:two-component system sensor histidine kinase PilS (NtrC family)
MMSTLRRRLLWLIAARAAVVTLLLGSAILIQLRSPGTLPVDPLFLVIGVTYALTALYSVALKFTERHRWLVDVQLAGDAVIVSAIMLITGGVGSYFSSLYTLPIIAASAIQSRRGALMVGLLSSVLYGGIVLTQYFGPELLPTALRTDLPPFRVASLTTGLNVFGFIAVATLSGYLAEGLRRADERLARASNQLADLQAFSQHVIDSLMSGLATTDSEGTLLTFNHAAESITGVSASDAVGAYAIDVLQLPPDVVGLFDAGNARTRLPRVEYAFRRTDGRQLEMGMSTAPLVTPSGEGGFILTFQDVTEARKLEREARVQQRLAAVGEMAAGIAHEIRNPLASMSGSIQILRQELPLTPDQSQLMDIVLRESERLNETIRSFLAYARPQRLGTTRFDVRRVITDTALLLKNNAELSDTHDIVVDVPDAEVPYEADEGQIRQIVWNLATNGLRAMPDGGRLRLSASRHEGKAPDSRQLRIAVEDEGVGIAAEEIDGIFQPFRGGFSRGTGLGLSIVHRIVSDYGGEVRVTSRKGEGTTVTVVLPVPLNDDGAKATAEKVEGKR